MAIDADIFRLAALALLALAVILLLAVLGRLRGLRRRLEDLRSPPSSARPDGAVLGAATSAAGPVEARPQPEAADTVDAASTSVRDEDGVASPPAVVQQEDELAVEGPADGDGRAIDRAEAEPTHRDGHAAEQEPELAPDEARPEEAEAAQTVEAGPQAEAEVEREHPVEGAEAEPVVASEESPEPAVDGAPSTTAAQQQQVDEAVEPERTRSVDASIWEPLTSSTETEAQAETSAESTWEAQERAATTEGPLPAEAGWGTDEPATAEAPWAAEERAIGEPESEPAGADLSEFPEEQPFERAGRWWFKRGQELLVYEEQTAQWVPAPTPPPPISAEGERGYQPSGDVQGSFWRCPSCGAVNGSTATTCRMCFAARP